MNPLALAFDALNREVARAMDTHPAFTSCHEGFAVILEEVDELWDEVKKKPKNRSHHKLRAEALQVAAMALRFAIELDGSV